MKSTSGGQPPQTFSSDVPREDAAAGLRSASMDRRTEEVSQVQRSLNFMTGLLTANLADGPCGPDGTVAVGYRLDGRWWCSLGRRQLCDDSDDTSGATVGMG